MRSRTRVTEVRRASSIDILISRNQKDRFKLIEVAEIVGMSPGYMRKLLDRKDAPQPSDSVVHGGSLTYLYTWDDVSRLSNYIKENARAQGTKRRDRLRRVEPPRR